MLQTISYGDEAVIKYSRNNGFQINTQNLSEGAYLLISAIFLFIFFVSIYEIKNLKKNIRKQKLTTLVLSIPMQNGKAVNSYVIAPVTFKLSDNLLNKNEPD